MTCVQSAQFGFRRTSEETDRKHAEVEHCSAIRCHACQSGVFAMQSRDVELIIINGWCLLKDLIIIFLAGLAACII